MLELIMETGTALGFESPASWSFPFPPHCSIRHWGCVSFNYEVCAHVWRGITEIIAKISVLNCGMDAGFELAKWGISLLQQQQQQITVCLSLTWLTPPDRASLYQLPGMGSSHGKNHGCSTSVNTEVQKQGHVYCCRLLRQAWLTAPEPVCQGTCGTDV